MQRDDPGDSVLHVDLPLKKEKFKIKLKSFEYENMGKTTYPLLSQNSYA